MFVKLNEILGDIWNGIVTFVDEYGLLPVVSSWPLLYYVLNKSCP